MKSFILIAWNLAISLVISLPLFSMASMPIERQSKHLSIGKIDVKPQQIIPFTFEQKISGLALVTKNINSWDSTYLIVHDDTLRLTRDEHDPNNNASNFIVFDRPIQNLVLSVGKLTGEITLILTHIDSTPNPVKLSSERRKSNCALPPIILQENWRNGLPAPQYTRSFSTVNHIIVHHSAGSNQASNYQDVVRNIYIYHTEGRGWSDIGYNYLIAPDGSIFAGRDPEEGLQDEVKGAHFCGKNSNTMGICLLGTFTDISPTPAAITALEQLISWKTTKDHLQPYEEFPHEGLALGVIAGHRDGCSTQCPGNQLYNKINTLKTTVYNQQLACQQDPEEPKEPVNDLLFFPNPVKNGTIFVSNTVEDVLLINAFGNKLFVPTIETKEHLELQVDHLVAGWYVLYIQDTSGINQYKVIII